MTLRSFLSHMWHYVRVLLRSVVYLTTALCCGLFLVAALSPYISPIRMVTPAFMGLAFPFLLLIMVLVTLYWVVLRRRWKIALVLAVVWAIGWQSVSNYFPINRSSIPKEDSDVPRLKVMSYNVAAFGFVAHSPNEPNPIFQYIRSSDADIVCLQEAMISAHISWAAISGQQVKRYFRNIYPYIHIGQGQRSGTTLILLSRYPIVSAETIPMQSRTNGAVRYTLTIEDRQVQVINAHLESFHLQPHDGERYVELARSGNAFGLQQALSTQLGPAFRSRSLQANVLHRLIAESSMPTIVCGDFNDTPVSYAHRKIGEGLLDAFAESGSGFGFTYTSGVFVVRIDHILVSKDFVPEGTTIDNTIKTSDHYPITTYLRWSE